MDKGPDSKYPDGGRLLERHFQTGIQIVIVGLLGWNFLTVQTMSVTIARLEEKLVAQNSTIILLSKLSDDRYRARDAERDFRIRDKAILAIDSRLVFVERLLFKEHDVGDKP